MEYLRGQFCPLKSSTRFVVLLECLLKYTTRVEYLSRQICLLKYTTRMDYFRSQIRLLKSSTRFQIPLQLPGPLDRAGLHEFHVRPPADLGAMGLIISLRALPAQVPVRLVRAVPLALSRGFRQLRCHLLLIENLLHDVPQYVSNQRLRHGVELL